MPLFVHHTCCKLYSLLYSYIVISIRYIEDFKEDIIIWTFGTNVPGGVGNVVKTKVERMINVSNQLGALWLIVSNVQVIRYNGIVHKHPS